MIFCEQNAQVIVFKIFCNFQPQPVAVGQPTDNWYKTKRKKEQNVCETVCLVDEDLEDCRGPFLKPNAKIYIYFPFRLYTVLLGELVLL